jgi:hypothetical protein
MTKLKIALLTGGALLVGLAVVLLLLLQNLDALVKEAIARYGSAAAGTSVRVADVAISLREGRGTLRGLTVANPPGYSQAALFTLDKISIALDRSALTADVPVIDEVRVGASAFRYELDNNGRSNLAALQQRAKDPTSKEPKGAKVTAEPSAQRRYRIKRLEIADGEAVLQLGSLGVGQAAVRVPGLVLRDLGGRRGLTAQELADTVLDALLKNLEKSVAGKGLDRLRHDRSGKTVEVLKSLLTH